MEFEKIAIVHDWFDTIGGSERVVEQLIILYPQADLFSLVDFLPENQRQIILNKHVNTSFIQHLPFARKHFRMYLPFMPLAIEQFDLNEYPLVISSSHAFAKGFIPSPEQIHISYIHTPIRYAWDLQNIYLKNAHLEKGLRSWAVRAVLHYLRNWDSRSANGIDLLIANSEFTSQRIWKYYRRESRVIYPPVDVDAFAFQPQKEDYFITVSRLVEYKQVEIIIEAFRLLPDLKLIIVGEGPLFSQIKNQLPSNVKLVGNIDRTEVVRLIQHARAMVYAAKEDFGIVLVESQACGTPVIAYKAGGALETINDEKTKSPTGIFFDEQTPQSIIQAVNYFLENKSLIKPEDCRQNAELFSVNNFRNNFTEVINSYTK
jgi:glycosyltransferase involved in cell wall biosynthesis